MVGEGSGVTARLVVADEHPIVRRAVRMSCDALSGLAVVGEADTGSDVLSLCEELRPDVAVLDIALPDGLDAIRGLNDRQLVEIVVVLTDRTDGASVMEHVLHGSGNQIGLGAMTEILLLKERGLVLVGPLPAEVQNVTHYEAVPARLQEQHPAADAHCLRGADLSADRARRRRPGGRDPRARHRRGWRRIQHARPAIDPAARSGGDRRGAAMAL